MFDVVVFAKYHFLKSISQADSTNTGSAWKQQTMIMLHGANSLLSHFLPSVLARISCLQFWPSFLPQNDAAPFTQTNSPHLTWLFHQFFPILEAEGKASHRWLTDILCMNGLKMSLPSDNPPAENRTLQAETLYQKLKQTYVLVAKSIHNITSSRVVRYTQAKDLGRPQ